MHKYTRGSITTLACIVLAACGESTSEPSPNGTDAPTNETTATEGPNQELIENAKAAASGAKQVAIASGSAGAMTATIAGEEKVFYIASDSNLIEWNEADDGSKRVEIIGSPVADDFTWMNSLELTFNVSGSAVTNPQIIFRSVGATDFHRTTSGQIVVSDVEIDGDRLTVSGSFSGTLGYQSFKKKPLEAYPQELTIDDGAFYVSFAN